MRVIQAGHSVVPVNRGHLRAMRLLHFGAAHRLRVILR